MTELNTGTDKLLGRVHGPVAVLSFNRPESRNALSDEIYELRRINILLFIVVVANARNPRKRGTSAEH